MFLPTNGVPGFPLLFLITSILTGMRDISAISNSDHLSNTSNIIPLGGNVNLSLLFIFKLDYVWFSCLFWRFGGWRGVVYSLYILNTKPLTAICLLSICGSPFNLVVQKPFGLIENDLLHISCLISMTLYYFYFDVL